MNKAKSINVQDNVGKNQNTEKRSIIIDITTESEEDKDDEKPCEPASNKNYLDIPNIIKHNKNIKIVRCNNNSKSHCTEEDSGPAYKKPKLKVSIDEDLQEKSKENLTQVGFPQTMFASPTILRKINPAKVATVKRESVEVNSISCQTETHPLLSIHNIKNNEKAIEFYTGLQTYEKFLYVFKSLGSDAYDLKYYYYDQAVTLTIFDQFFLTLTLLRQHKTHYEMSILFDVTLKDIKNIFITWIRFMKLEWSNIKFPLSYIFEVKINSNKKDGTVADKDSDIEITYSKNVNANENVSKNNRAVPDKNKSLKKAYKILNGPQNYIESHLMNDIVIVCQALCYFKAKRISHKQQNAVQ